MTATVTIEHCRRLRYCSRGMRRFFQRHGLDWRQFREQGLPAEQLEATGDGMAKAAAALARQDQEEGEQ